MTLDMCAIVSCNVEQAVCAVYTHACGTCPIAAIWLPRATNFSFVFSLVSPAGFVGSEQD